MSGKQQSLIPEKRPRKVFGRIRITHDGSIYTIEMQKDTLVVRKKHSKNAKKIKLIEIVDYAKGQFSLKF